MREDSRVCLEQARALWLPAREIFSRAVNHDEYRREAREDSRIEGALQKNPQAIPGGSDAAHVSRSGRDTGAAQR